MTTHAPRPAAKNTPPLADVLVALAFITLVIALLAAGGAPKSSPAGLTAAGPFASWAVPVLRLVGNLAAIATGGAALAAAKLLPATDDGRFGQRGLRACQDAAVAAAIWAIARLGELVTTASVILGVPLSRLPARAGDASTLPQIRALAAAVAVAAVLALVLSGGRTVSGIRPASFLVALGLIGPLLTGHAAAERTVLWSAVARVALVLHVLAATVWVGGLGALVRYARAGSSASAVRRYSRLALVAATATGFSGLLVAEIHLGRPGGWSYLTGWATGYGSLVLAKSIAFIGLVSIGWWHRRTTINRLEIDGGRVFWRLVAVELLVMSATLGLAVALSRTP